VSLSNSEVVSDYIPPPRDVRVVLVVPGPVPVLICPVPPVLTASSRVEVVVVVVSGLLQELAVKARSARAGTRMVSFFM
jgi:hypothetical protein